MRRRDAGAFARGRAERRAFIRNARPSRGVRPCGTHAHAIRVDQGSGFVSRELDPWPCQRGVTLDFSRPGKPTDNAFIETLNGMVRSACVNAHGFMSLADAQAKCEAWRSDDNEARPHSGIGNKPPARLATSARCTRPSPTE
jgi:putative transposase